MRTLTAALIALLPLAACSTESSSSPDTTGSAPVAMAEAERVVSCGCVIEEVHRCSEWVDVDGEWVALELPTDMGSMPFCGKDGLVARVEGELVEGVYRASTFELLGN